ncbi:hypothetical protein ABTX99_26795 [Streptomyces flaveolus]|uniref:hypothetical protein n=1 Tax=Streptomyces flaveolus TaxID=67297 RepID=UPI003328746B
MGSRLVVGVLREQLAVEDLTQPHWWTLNHVAGELHRQVHEGVDSADFVTTINVSRRMVADLGGDGNLPE